MSYTLFIFFGEQNLENLSAAVHLTETIVGFHFSGAENNQARLLDISLEVCQRSSFLCDTEDMPFGDFQYQLELSTPVFRGELIHPIGLYLTREFSSRLNQRSMLCLAGVEFLGAIFEKGQLVTDRMGVLPKLHFCGPWQYCPESL